MERLIPNCLQDHVRVRRVISSSDFFVTSTLELYKKLFPEEEGNYGIDEIMEIMDPTPAAIRHVQVENIVLVATFREAVAGFLFCHFYPERRKSIISYFAIDKNIIEARMDSVVANRLLRKLKTILLEMRQCDVLFYDVESAAPATCTKKGIRKKGRARVFKAHARKLGLEAREFLFPYESPRVSLSEHTLDQAFILFCIGINSRIPNEISRHLMLEFLRFVYLDGYGDAYPPSDPRFAQHQEHLQELLSRYEQTLPDIILAV